MRYKAELERADLARAMEKEKDAKTISPVE
jgi:hypothetical protein